MNPFLKNWIEKKIFLMDTGANSLLGENCFPDRIRVFDRENTWKKKKIKYAK